MWKTLQKISFNPFKPQYRCQRKCKNIDSYITRKTYGNLHKIGQSKQFEKIHLIL